MTGNVFLAADLSDGERHGLAMLLSEAGLGPMVPGKRTRPNNWHITLRFIGEAADHEVERLAERTEAVLDAEPCRVWLTTLGGFPKPSKASVLFLDVDDSSTMLDRIAANCEEAAVEAGFDSEDRPFKPHLTLSRIRPPVDIGLMTASFESLRFPIDIPTVTMFRSERDSDGLKYVPLYRFEL